MANMIDKLDSIILSNNVVNDFYYAYGDDILFKKWLDETIPEIRECEKQKQNNPWHKYNVLGHILHSVDAMNKQTINLPNGARRLLAYTMLLHDIGKPECHITRKKDGEVIDSFFNHNVASAKVAKRVGKTLQFNDEEVAVLDKLVYKHDIFMFIKDFPTTNPHWRTLTPEVVEDEITELNTVGDGDKLMRYLVMVGRADNLAQNEAMTSVSLNMLDKIDTMLDERAKEKE